MGNDKITATLRWLNIPLQELANWVFVDTASPVKARQATALTSSTMSVGLMTPTGRGAYMYCLLVDMHASCYAIKHTAALHMLRPRLISYIRLLLLRPFQYTFVDTTFPGLILHSTATRRNMV